MLESRDKIENSLWREPRNGTVNFWYETWSRLYPIIYLILSSQIVFRSEEANVFMQVGQRNEKLMWQQLPSYPIDHIITDLSRREQIAIHDKP